VIFIRISATVFGDGPTPTACRRYDHFAIARSNSMALEIIDTGFISITRLVLFGTTITLVTVPDFNMKSRGVN
jgi:hypothetical protein